MKKIYISEKDLNAKGSVTIDVGTNIGGLLVTNLQDAQTVDIDFGGGSTYAALTQGAQVTATRKLDTMRISNVVWKGGTTPSTSTAKILIELFAPGEALYRPDSGIVQTQNQPGTSVQHVAVDSIAANQIVLVQTPPASPLAVTVSNPGPIGVTADLAKVNGNALSETNPVFVTNADTNLMLDVGVIHTTAAGTYTANFNMNRFYRGVRLTAKLVATTGGSFTTNVLVRSANGTDYLPLNGANSGAFTVVNQIIENTIYPGIGASAGVNNYCNCVLGQNFQVQIVQTGAGVADVHIWLELMI